MVQEFHVLRCFACQTFQVQQVKKAKKWNCKMCGEKQSVIKEYGRGTGADCRRHVQKLNGLRGQLLEEEDESAWSRWEEDEGSEVNHEDQDLSSEPQQNFGESRWSKYVDTAEPSEDVEEEDENVYTESTRFVSQGNVRKRKRGGRGRFGAGGSVDPQGDEEEDQGQQTGSWGRQRGSWKRKRGGRGRFGAGWHGDPEGDEEEDKGQQTGPWGRHRGSWKRKRGGRGRFGAGWHGDPEEEEEEDQGQQTGPWGCHRGSWKQMAGSSRPLHPAAVTTEDCTFSTPSFHSITPTPSAASKAPPSHIPSRTFHHAHQHRPSQPSGVTTESRAIGSTSAPTRRTPLADTPLNKGTSVVTSLQPVSKVGQPECKSSSKWAKFLTVPSVEDQEEREQQQQQEEDGDGDGDGTAHWSDLDEASESGATSWSVAYCSTAAPVTPYVPAVNFGANKRVKSCSSGLFSGAVPSLAKGALGVADKVKSAAACFGFSSATSQVQSPAFTAKTFRQDGAVDQQPRPSKRPCTTAGLGGVSSLFQTDEDFDIAF